METFDNYKGVHGVVKPGNNCFRGLILGLFGRSKNIMTQTLCRSTSKWKALLDKHSGLKKHKNISTSQDDIFKCLAETAWAKQLSGTWRGGRPPRFRSPQLKRRGAPGPGICVTVFESHVLHTSRCCAVWPERSACNMTKRRCLRNPF